MTDSNTEKKTIRDKTAGLDDELRKVTHSLNETTLDNTNMNT
jgi:hypothetical protein